MGRGVASADASQNPSPPRRRHVPAVRAFIKAGAPLSEAVGAYKRAIELNPNAAGALVNLGAIHYHLRKFKEAADYYQKAIDVDPFDQTRRGSGAGKHAKFKVAPHSLGFKPGIDLDKLNQLVDQIEVEEFARKNHRLLRNYGTIWPTVAALKRSRDREGAVFPPCEAAFMKLFTKGAVLFLGGAARQTAALPILGKVPQGFPSDRWALARRKRSLRIQRDDTSRVKLARRGHGAHKQRALNYE